MSPSPLKNFLEGIIGVFLPELTQAPQLAKSQIKIFKTHRNKKMKLIIQEVQFPETPQPLNKNFKFKQEAFSLAFKLGATTQLANTENLESLIFQTQELGLFQEGNDLWIYDGINGFAFHFLKTSNQDNFLDVNSLVNFYKDKYPKAHWVKIGSQNKEVPSNKRKF